MIFVQTSLPSRTYARFYYLSERRYFDVDCFVSPVARSYRPTLILTPLLKRSFVRE